MDLPKTIKHILIDKDMTAAELSHKLDFVSSPQVLSNKFYRDNFTFNEVQQIADVLGCDIQIKDRETGKIF